MVYLLEDCHLYSLFIFQTVLYGKLPSEFARQPRSLAELDRWKATELRNFLLYTGPVVLKGIIDVNQYRHFLSFSVAIRLLRE